MANTFTSFVNKDVGTSPATIVTVAASTQTTIIGMTCANTTAAGITVDVYVTRSAVDHYIVKDAAVPPGGTLVPVGGNQKVVLVAADVLKIESSAASSVDAITSVLEIT